MRVALVCGLRYHNKRVYLRVGKSLCMKNPKMEDMKVVGISAAAIAAGVCLALACPASAEIHYPVGSGSFNRGNYWGNWSATITKSQVHTNSFSNHQYCKAVQDRYKVNEMTTGINTPCDVSAIGGNSAHYDYVEFYLK